MSNDREHPMRRPPPTAASLFFALAFAAPAPASAAGESLVEFELCRDVDERAGVDCGQAFAEDVGQVYALIAVELPGGGSGNVVVVWRYGDQVTQRQTLKVPFHRPGGYRTRARQRIAPRFTGQWSVEVQDADGRSLVTRAFTVGEAAPAEPDAAPAVVPPAPLPAAPPDEAMDPSRRPAGGALQPEARPAGEAVDPEARMIEEAVDPEAREVEAVDPEAREIEEAVDPETRMIDEAAQPEAAPVGPQGAAPAEDPQAAALAADDPQAAAPIAAPPPPSPPAGDARPASLAPAEPEGDGRRFGALMLLAGGVLLLVAGVLVARRRSARAPAAAVEAPSTPPGPVPEASAAEAPAAAAGEPGEAAAVDALQRLSDLVIRLWSAWVTATGGSPQAALNAAWRAEPDAARLSLDHIRLCNALESAARDYTAIPPRGSSVELLRLRVYAQAPALLGVVCALAVEIERLGLAGAGLDAAFEKWGGREPLTAELLTLLDDAAAALGTRRLSIVPYRSKAAAAKREAAIELKPFPLPAPLVERLRAGSRIVRVESAPFADAEPVAVWGLTTA